MQTVQSALFIRSNSRSRGRRSLGTGAGRSSSPPPRRSRTRSPRDKERVPKRRNTRFVLMYLQHIHVRMWCMSLM